MKILDVINKSWAIVPSVHEQIINVYKSHILRGEKLDFKALQPKKEFNEKNFELLGNKAIVPVTGPITKGFSFFSFFFRGSSTKTIKAGIIEALDDSSVEEIILNIDSPGGTVDGTFELADFIYESRGQKPIIAFSDGMIASAAYLIAASTDKILITGKTNEIGSIGVIATHIDYSEQNKKWGESVTEVVSGKYKNIYSPEKPLSDLGLKTLQDEVDYIFSIFATDVATRRNMPVEEIVNQEARIYIGQQASDAGLVDGITTFDELTASAPKTQIKGFENMNRDELHEKHPDLLSEIEDSAKKAGIKQGKNDGFKEGVEAERKRSSAFVALKSTYPGQENVIQEMMDNGTELSDAIIRLNAGEQLARETAQTNIEKEAPKEVATTEPPQPEIDKKQQTQENEELTEEKIKEEWDANPELKNEFESLDQYSAYRLAETSGQARIHGIHKGGV
jgi:signal peptide peptidase SppA